MLRDGAITFGDLAGKLSDLCAACCPDLPRVM
jgi:hypothetical protein